MLNLAIAALFLLGTHFGIASTLLRGQLIARVGEGFYRMLYSLLALSAFAWLVLAWRAAPFDPLWSTGVGLHHLVAALMPLPLLLAVCAVTAPNPTVVGQRPDPDASAPAAGIIRVTRHPLMWAIGIWALLHLAVNGDLGFVTRDCEVVLRRDHLATLLSCFTGVHLGVPSLSIIK